jgi:hypothetical protein
MQQRNLLAMSDGGHETSELQPEREGRVARSGLGIVMFFQVSGLAKRGDLRPLFDGETHHGDLRISISSCASWSRPTNASIASAE